jgi:hypothetical protein
MVSGLVSIVFALSVGCNIVNRALFLRRRLEPSIMVAALAGVLRIILVSWNEIANAGGSCTTAIGVL